MTPSHFIEDVVIAILDRVADRYTVESEIIGTWRNETVPYYRYWLAKLPPKELQTVIPGTETGRAVSPSPNVREDCEK